MDDFVFENKILSYLSYTPVTIDDITYYTKIPVHIVSKILTKLHIEDRIQKINNVFYIKI